MKFDVARAMAWVQAFDFPRDAGLEGERRAAQTLAERLEQLGWRVESSGWRNDGRISFLVGLSLVGLLSLAYNLAKALRLVAPGLAPPTRAALVVAGVAGACGLIGLVAGRTGTRLVRDWFRGLRSGESPGGRVNLIAYRPRDSQAATRVIVLTHLDTTRTRGGFEGWAWTALVLGLMLLTRAGVPAAGRAFLWSLTSLALIVALVRLVTAPRRPEPGDNRTGLATLAELAEVLPGSVLDRVELYLAAVGGSEQCQAGSCSLARGLVRRWPAKPTLAVNLDAPGLGSELVIHGQGAALELARSAAADLWIPHRVNRWPYCALDHRPFLLSGIAGLSLAGDRKARRIQPAGLASAAQLATEIALRWSRRGGEAPQDDSLARSSQKPG